MRVTISIIAIASAQAWVYVASFQLIIRRIAISPTPAPQQAGAEQDTADRQGGWDAEANLRGRCGMVACRGGAR
jgi:hypothetical protein